MRWNAFGLALLMSCTFFFSDASGCWRGRQARCIPYIPLCEEPTSPPRPDPTPPTGTQTTRVRILLIGLTKDASIGAGIKTNLNNLKGLLETGIPAERRDAIRIVEGDQVTADNIRMVVDQRDVQPSESIFCYYSGHGGYDPARAENDPSNGHHFQIPVEDLMRKDLWDRLKKKNARLTALITDTCNVKSVANIKAVFTRKTVFNNSLLISLLLNNTGDVDISGSAKDQFGWFSSPAPGGWFTFSLVKASEDQPFANPTAVTWPQFLQKVSDNTNTFFQARKTEILANPGMTPAAVLDQLRGQTEQRAQAFQMDARVASANDWSNTRPAQILVQLPKDGKLFIADAPTTQTSARRLFVTPPLMPTADYYYTLRMETVRNGNLWSESKQIIVRAGQTTHVQFGIVAAETALDQGALAVAGQTRDTGVGIAGGGK